MPGFGIMIAWHDWTGGIGMVCPDSAILSQAADKCFTECLDCEIINVVKPELQGAETFSWSQSRNKF
jgi:hypothetical protein